MAIEVGKRQDLDKDPRLSNPQDDFYGKFEEFAMFKCSFYMCFRCSKPYFGGLIDCGAANEANIKKEDLICGKCSAEMVGAGVKSCDIHKTDFIDYKCKYCCNVALFFCFGTTHYCKPCHD